MRTKLVAARIATQAGVAMAIALGHREHPIAALEAGAKCTWFLPAADGRSARKNWIAGHLAPLGVVTVDAGAVRALRKGSSLLPAGILGVSGVFERGDAVDVVTVEGVRVARGLAAYSSADAAVIAGHRSEDFEGLLGWRGRDEVIHRDDLVLV
jgi:glutamate 5-kinase